jgi:hypothetical protein
VIARLAGPIGGEAAHQAAINELRKAEYHRDDPGLTDRILTWLVQRLGWLLSGTTAGSAGLLVLVLLGGVGIFAVVRARSARAGVRAQAAERADPLRPLHARDHRVAAERLAAEGRRAEALREWLRATVQTIEERGVLDPRPGRTGDDIAREAGVLLPSAADALTVAMDAFDLVWFGGRPATDADLVAGRAAAGAVRAARIERHAATAGAHFAAPR